MFVDDLVAALGDAVILDPDVVAAYARDQSAGTPAGSALAVLTPTTTDEVATAIRIAATHGVVVVARGAGSGLAGGANAVDGCLIVSFARMCRILSIDVANGYAVVEPGVVNADLRAAAAVEGLWYAPDPASRDYCTIGGNVATNAGGLCCVKYGVTRDAVLALQVVLADGRVMRTGHRSVKGVGGLDLTALITGSEGTLALITEITVRLLPLPAPALTVVAMMPTVTAAGQAIETLLRQATPSLLEIMDATSVRAVESWRSLGLDTAAAAVLIVQTDGARSGADDHATAIETALTAAGATEVYRADSVEESEMLLTTRRLAFPAMERLGDVLLEDVAVPRGAITRMLVAIEEIAARYDVVIGTYGHAGDGNLHPTIVVPPGDRAARTRAEQAFHAVMAAALNLGGTVTGEHGVGLVKTGALALELDDVSIDVQCRVKAALDPDGLLNPGKALAALPAAALVS